MFRTRIAPLLAAALLGLTTLAPHYADAQSRTMAEAAPIAVTIFAPGRGDIAGVAGKGFVIDLALDAAPGHNMDLLGNPRFIAPTDPAFAPGPNPAIPGLVVALSTNKKHTNLANLFQLTGVGTVSGHKEIWTTWLVGKALFGVNVDTTLTVYVVKGMAPRLVPDGTSNLNLLSPVQQVTFHIAGPAPAR